MIVAIDRYLDAGLLTAAASVNGLTPGSRHGRPARPVRPTRSR